MRRKSLPRRRRDRSNDSFRSARSVRNARKTSGAHNDRNAHNDRKQRVPAQPRRVRQGTPESTQLLFKTRIRRPL